MLTETITEDAAQIYKLYDIALESKWFPVFYLLSHSGAATITDIVKQIGHSQPSVSKIVAGMVKNGIVKEEKDATDGRSNLVSLSTKGINISKKITGQYTDVNKAIDDILTQTTNNLWKAIEEWEYLLEEKSLLRRVLEQKKLRESANVKIVEYEPKYQDAFRELNEEWISTYFKIEEADKKALLNPKGYILDKGGHIRSHCTTANPLALVH